MRHVFRILPIALLLLLAASWIFAQEGEGTDAGDVTFALPITEDLNYTVTTGDSLEIIASRFDVSLACLRETNNLTNTPEDNTLQLDDVLLISVDCPFYVGMQDVEFPRVDARESADPDTYIVQARQTLDEIAQELDISLVSLQLANEIESARDVIPGMVLTIPADAPPYGEFPALDTPAGEGTDGVGGGFEGELYVVQPNDTLDTIAQELDVAVGIIMVVNELEDTRITPGMSLLIPEGDGIPAYGEVVPLDFMALREGGGVGGGAEGELYIVQPGDTLDTIGQELDVSVISLRIANELEDDATLRIGQTLIIPEGAPPYGVFPALDTPAGEGTDGVGGGFEGELYVVQPNDTLDTIAQELDVAVGIIMVVNELEDTRITPGMSLLIPEGDGIPVYGEVVPLDFMALSEGGGVGGGAEGELYIVQPGDTLDTIGQEFNVSVISLGMVNELTSGSILRIGQTLIIPAGAPAYGLFPALDTPEGDEAAGVGGGFEGDVYVVQVNDNLDQIAADFNAATSCIIEANAITNVRSIRPGQTILIPTGCPAYAGVAVPRVTTTAPTPQTTEEAPAEESSEEGAG